MTGRTNDNEPSDAEKMFAGPELDAAFLLDPAAVERYREQGFVRLQNVLSAETIAHHEPEITSKVIELNTMHLPIAERSTYGKAFLQVTNLWRHSAAVEQLVRSRRLARIAAELMGVNGVRLYHDQALYKEPGGGFTPWHADQYYWPLSTDRTCTVWIPLQETPLDMGPLSFAVGSHRFAWGRDLEISDESEEALQSALAGQGFALSEAPYRLGEVSFHSGWTFHRAAANHAQLPRRVMTIIYMDADIRVAEPVNEHQRSDLRGWMPGAQVGEVPDTPLNPVLYRR